jgi:hypothetical protein
MLKSSHSFAIEVLKGSEVLARRPIGAGDLKASLEWLRFRAIRAGRLPPRMGPLPSAWAEPIRRPPAGRTGATGIRLGLLEGSRPGDVVAAEIPFTVLRPLAEEVAAGLVAEGKLADGETFSYRLRAAARDEGTAEADAGGPGSPRFRIEETEWDLPIDESPLEGFLEGASYRGEPDPEEFPVFLPDRILAEATALKARAGEAETGGVLLGRLHRDSRVPEVFVEVTDQVHAEAAQGNSTRLTFTAETWEAVREEIHRRGRGELQVGFWHTHPAREWCARCESEKRSRCAVARPFFSAEDRRMHAAAFPRAYSIALVVGDEADGDRGWKVYHALFGWSRGAIVPRGFHVASRPSPEASVDGPRGEEDRRW